MNNPVRVQFLTEILAIGLLPALAVAQPPSGSMPVAMISADTTVMLDEHTYVIPDNNSGAVPNVGIVVGAQATLVIDFGLGRRNGETVLAEVAKVSNNDKIYIATTHYHPEHNSGYAAFPDSATYVSSTAQEQESAERWEEILGFFAANNPAFGEMLADAERRVADVTFDREYNLDLGGVTVTMLMVGPTHTRGDTAFFVVEDEILFSGDVVMKDSFLMALQDADIDAWLQAFDTFEALEPDQIVPSHGPFGDADTIAENRLWVTLLIQRADALRAQSVPVDVATQTISAELTSMYPNWGRQRGIEGLVSAVYER